MSARTVVFVVGMMRSGTSALTRVLSLCGCELPDVVLGATNRNPRGEWESIESLKMNDKWLTRNNTTPFDPTSWFPEEGGAARAGTAELVDQARQFLVKC